ncbi:MAG: hypothetical protein V1722_02270 [Candidatus Micrarchaeota archaeon]
MQELSSEIRRSMTAASEKLSGLDLAHKFSGSKILVPVFVGANLEKLNALRERKNLRAITIHQLVANLVHEGERPAHHQIMLSTRPIRHSKHTSGGARYIEIAFHEIFKSQVPK